MFERVDYAGAAEILEVHIGTIAVWVAHGKLTSSGRRGASLDRAEVEGLALRRAEEREARAARPPARQHRRVDHRPDYDHEWLSPDEVGALVGITGRTITYHLHRGNLPGVQNGGRWWVRRDLLEMVEAARLVTRTRRP